MKTVKKWLSGKPSKCEFCNRPFDSVDKYFYDFKTRKGFWCLGCKDCFKYEDGKLGIGYGQKYKLKTMEKVG